MREIEKLKHKVRVAILLFMENDSELLTLAGGVHEQAISHRIAVYLGYLFQGLHVDCEYNKHCDDPKKIGNIDEARHICSCKSCEDWKTKNNNGENRKSAIKNSVRIRPDILVHARGVDGKNKISIEIKKEEECEYDKVKLMVLTDSGGNFKYKIGVFLCFTKEGSIKPWVKWFTKDEPEGSELETI